jgi:F420-dependent oxidoreductase-like protein
MRLGMTLGYSGAQVKLDVERVQEAERLGYHIVWTAESYGSDAATPLAWIGALTSKIELGTGIMQMPARSPANTAMTAMTIDQLSGGRMVLGLGMSGPQVVEGWHGSAYGKPIKRTREYVAICRAIFAREAPLEFSGEYYRIPYQGIDATGLGKPLKSIVHGRKDLPIYLAAIGPKNVALAAEVADGWIPVFFSPQRYARVFEPAVHDGFKKAGGKDYNRFDIAPYVHVALGDDLRACMDSVKPQLALYVGGMGAKNRNFYNDLACRYGYEADAAKIQELYLSGRQKEAVASVPDALVDEVALVGPKERIRERLAEWKRVPVTTLNVATGSLEALRLLAELVL